MSGINYPDPDHPTTRHLPTYVCPTEGCLGDARYAPPGRGHRAGCNYLTTDPTTTARLDTTDPDRPRGDVGLGDARLSELAEVLREVSGPIYQNGGRYTDVAEALAPLVAGWLGEERAAVEVGAADDRGPENCIPTPAQLLRRFYDGNEDERLAFAERAIVNSEKAHECFVMNHRGRIGHLQRGMAGAHDRLAEAWLKGHAAGRDYQADGWNSDAHDPDEDNPYRGGTA